MHWCLSKTTLRKSKLNLPLLHPVHLLADPPNELAAAPVAAGKHWPVKAGLAVHTPVVE